MLQKRKIGKVKQKIKKKRRALIDKISYLLFFKVDEMFNSGNIVARKLDVLYNKP